MGYFEPYLADFVGDSDSSGSDEVYESVDVVECTDDVEGFRNRGTCLCGSFIFLSLSTGHLLLDFPTSRLSVCLDL